MIARYWSARATPANLSAYRLHFEKNVIPELKIISGFVRADLLTRVAGKEAEIVVLSVWDSMEAVTAFAGPDPEAAAVAPAAAVLFTDYDRRVRHFEIAASV
ncbi:MAG TPA: antibiotic biosynthesis monooxygenase [Candidatus Acidoferrum sp.]|nr:antibiotic biosynthesis monooxygenase [Candidatus Acidoferrum sp.]